MQPYQSGPLQQTPSMMVGLVPDNARSAWMPGAFIDLLKRRVTAPRRVPPPPSLAGRPTREPLLREVLIRADHAAMPFLSTVAPGMPSGSSSISASISASITPSSTSPSMSPKTRFDAAGSVLPGADAILPVMPASDLLALMQFDGVLQFTEAAWELADDAASPAHSRKIVVERYTRRIPDYYFEFSPTDALGTTLAPDDVRIAPYDALSESRPTLTDMRLSQLLDEIHRHRSARSGSSVGHDWNRDEWGRFHIRSIAELAYPARLVAREPPPMKLSEAAEANAVIAATAQPLHRPVLVMFPGNTLVWVSIAPEPKQTILSDMISNIDKRDLNDAMAISWIL